MNYSYIDQSIGTCLKTVQTNYRFWIKIKKREALPKDSRCDVKFDELRNYFYETKWSTILRKIKIILLITYSISRWFSLSFFFPFLLLLLLYSSAFLLHHLFLFYLLSLFLTNSITVSLAIYLLVIKIYLLVIAILSSLPTTLFQLKMGSETERRNLSAEHPAVTNFRRYLRIKTVQPEPDYGQCAFFCSLIWHVPVHKGRSFLQKEKQISHRCLLLLNCRSALIGQAFSLLWGFI